MKKMIAVLLLTICLSGCGTVLSNIIPSDVFGNNNKYYTGTLFDTSVVIGWAGGGMDTSPESIIIGIPLFFLFLADLPISLGVDTVLLPFQFVYYNAYEIR